MNIAQAIFEVMENIVESFGKLISGVFNSAVGIIWDTTDKALTPIGVLMLIGVAVGLFFFAFKWVRSLIRMRG